MNNQPDWLNWGRKIQAIAQTGLTFTDNPYDRHRYEQLHELALEIFAAHTGEAASTIDAWFKVQPGYATPKVDVRGACFRDGKILLVREKSDGGWCLPGGWADVGDVPSESAVREVQEEAGFECAAKKMIGAFDANRGGEPLAAFHAVKLIYLCEIEDRDRKSEGERDGVTEVDDRVELRQVALALEATEERLRGRTVLGRLQAHL